MTAAVFRPEVRPDVTVVVVTWEGKDLLGPCLRSVREQDLPHRVVVVDNASTDGTARLLREEFPEAEVVTLGSNTGFAGGVAAALEVVDTRWVALLNNDAEAAPGWLRAAVDHLECHPGVAATSSRMLLAEAGRMSGGHSSNDSDIHGPATVNNLGISLLGNGYGVDRGLGELDSAAFDEPVEVFGASGGAAVLRTLAVKAVGGLEARYFMYYEDLDLSWRLRLAGWQVTYCPDAVVRHRHAASSRPGSEAFAFHTERNRLLTLVRCAPAGVVATQVLRFALTTASVARSRVLHRPLPTSAVFSVIVRLRVLASLARLAPDLTRVRVASTRATRAAVWSRWSGAPTHPLAPPVGRSSATGSKR